MATEITSPSQLPNVYGVEQWHDCQLFCLSPVPDSILIKTYELLEKDGLLPFLFYEGVPSQQEYLDWLKSPAVRYVTGWVRPTLDSDYSEIAGIGLAYNVAQIEGKWIAEVAQAFSRPAQASGVTAPLSRIMTKFAFERLGLDALFGVTPVANRPAIRFIESVGFKRLGVLPGYRKWNGRPVSCVVSVKTEAAA